MFSGIIEGMGTVVSIDQEGGNVHFGFSCKFLDELHIDQSVAHNGVCLTVVVLENDHYIVTAIKETLEKTNLGKLSVGDRVNLERSVTPDTRMDGHYVQGHVDTTARCTGIREADGSWYYEFEVEKLSDSLLMVDKGSIAINGTSLTLVKNRETTFSVAIIPYTYENTTFQDIRVGDLVNIEYDVMGKYIAKYLGNLKEELINAMK